MRATPGAGIGTRARDLTSEAHYDPAGCREPTTTGKDRAMVDTTLSTGTSTTSAAGTSTTDQRSILMAPDESTEIVLVRLDGRLASLEQSMKRLEGSVERQSTVDIKLYLSEQAAQDRAIVSLAGSLADLKVDLGKRVEDAEHGNRTTLLLLIGAILSALAGGLVRLALG